MSNLSNKALSDQIERIKRRLFGHGVRYELPGDKQVFVKRSNRDRLFRLLMRKAEFEAELLARKPREGASK